MVEVFSFLDCDPDWFIDSDLIKHQPVTLLALSPEGDEGLVDQGRLLMNDLLTPA